MTDEFYTGSWEGSYSYGSGYGKNLAGTKESFLVEIVLKDGVLSGSCTDRLTRERMGAPAVLTGFIEGTLISFIKKYVYNVLVNEKGEEVIDKAKKPHEVHYTGSFDPVANSFSGDWDIEVVLEKGIDGDVLQISSGTWELRKAFTGSVAE